MDLTEEPTAVPGWEAAKENVLPVKKGRSAKGLSEILVRPVSKTLEEEQEHAFEELIHSTAAPSEKLELYGRYLKWARDTFPSSTDKIMQILEQGTRELQEHEELKNEPKYVMMWIDYADLVRTPGEVFTYMSTNKLGERVALFWVAWAYVAEKALNYKLTDQIFQKAIRRGAEPKDLLNQRYKQFMRRMARLYLNNSTDPGEGTGAAQYTESADRNAVVDNAITQRAMEAIRAQPSVTAAPVAQPAVPGERRALNTLAGHTNTSTPALPVAAHAHPAVTSRRSSSSTSRSSSRAPAPASGVAPRASNVGFEIFSDTPAVGNNASAHSASAGTSRREVAPHLYEADRDSAAINNTASAAPAATWKQLGTEAVRRKENDGPVTKWSAGPLFPAAAAGSSTTVPTTIPTTTTTSIPIYVDEEFQVSDSTTSHTAHTAHHAVPENVLSVRRQLDAADVILKNPLLRHTAALSKDAPLTKEPATDKAESAKVRTALGEVAKTKAPVVAERVEELPVFTSLPHPAVPAVPKGSAGSAAGRGLSVSTSGKSTGSGMGSGGSTSGGLPFAIFSDTPTNTTSINNTSAKNSTTTTISPIKRGAFSVYESPTGSVKTTNTNTTAAAKASTNTSTTTGGGGMGFAIYSDEPAAANLPAKKSTTANTNTATSSSNKGMGFAIYSDEPAPLPAAPVPAAAAKKTSSGTSGGNGGKGFTIFADEPAAPPAPAVVVRKEKLVFGGGSTGSSTSVGSTGSGSGMSFAIYSDDAASATTVTSIATICSAGAAKKGPSFDIFVDNTTTTTATNPTNTTTNTTTPHTTSTTTSHPTTSHTTTSTSTSEEEQEAELQGLLDNLLQADSEDGTINTRLARRDIDMMFCSPTIHRHPAATSGAGSGAGGAGGSGGNVNSSVVHDENAMPFTIRAPPRTPGPNTGTTTTTLRALPREEDEEVFADEFDNDYSESTHPHHTTTTRANNNYTSTNTTTGDKVVYHSSASSGGGTSGRQQQQQRAFGAHLDTFSAVKDLSAIKESSQEFSMCGMMLETPGHTNTLGFGALGRQHYSSNYNNSNNRASYSTMGGLMDFDISHSRDSIGSVHQHPATAPPATSTQGGARGGGGGGSLGFAIFQDDTPVKVKSSGSENENAHKRKEPSGSAGTSNSSQQEPYLGLQATDELPPSRRRLYNPCHHQHQQQHQHQHQQQHQQQLQGSAGSAANKGIIGGASSSTGAGIAMYDRHSSGNVRRSSVGSGNIQSSGVESVTGKRGHGSVTTTTTTTSNTTYTISQHNTSPTVKRRRVSVGTTNTTTTTHTKPVVAVGATNFANSSSVAAPSPAVLAQVQTSPPLLFTTHDTNPTPSPPITGSNSSAAGSGSSVGGGGVDSGLVFTGVGSCSGSSGTSAMDMPVFIPAITTTTPLLAPLLTPLHTTTTPTAPSTTPIQLLLQAAEMHSTTKQSSRYTQGRGAMGRTGRSSLPLSQAPLTLTSAPPTRTSPPVVPVPPALSTLPTLSTRTLPAPLPPVALPIPPPPPVVMYEADLFYTLEADTFACIVELLMQYYRHSAGTNHQQHQHISPYKHNMLVVHRPDAAAPACFTFRNKVNTSERHILPHVVYGSSGGGGSCGGGGGNGGSGSGGSSGGATANNTTRATSATNTTSTSAKQCHGVWSVVANIGRGTYGHAILMQRCSSSGGGSGGDGSGSGTVSCGSGGTAATTTTNTTVERSVYKVDTGRDSVLWEAFVHMQIQQRILTGDTTTNTTTPTTTTHHTTATTTHSLHHLYTTHLLPPHALYVYRACAVLGLGYANFGTLVNALRVLIVRGVLAVQEHEYVAAYLSVQMVEALICVHSVGILHCDVKTDNWLLERCTDTHHPTSTITSTTTTSSVGVRVRLIDFGRSLSAITTVNSTASADKQDTSQLDSLRTLYNTSTTTSTTSHPPPRGAGEEVRYRGEVSAKGYTCREMGQGQPWSYQIDLHGLCTCIHQLLHLSPLTLCHDESAAQCAQRGLGMSSAVSMIVGGSGVDGVEDGGGSGGCDGVEDGGGSGGRGGVEDGGGSGGGDGVEDGGGSGGGDGVEDGGGSGGGSGSGCSGGGMGVDGVVISMVQELNKEGFTVPQASLKRYWHKPLWGAVYLTLLNSALFKPLLTHTSVGRVGSGGSGSGSAGPPNYSVTLLTSLRGALGEYMSSVQRSVAEAAVSKLVAKLTEDEL